VSNLKHISTDARRGLWFIVLAAVLWGTVGVSSKAVYSLADTNPLSIGFYRLVFSLPVLAWACWRRLGRAAVCVPRRDLAVMLAIGIAMALYQVCYFAAIQRVGVAVAVLVTLCVAPMIVALFSTLLLREPLTGAVALALLAALSGTALLVGGAPAASVHGDMAVVGVLLALGAAASYAAITLCSRALTGMYHPLQPITIGFAAGTLLLLPCALATGLTLDYPVSAWGLLLYLGIIPTALAYVFFLSGMRHTTATVASTVTLVEPLTSASLAWLLFGEQLGRLGVLGAVLLLAAMLLLYRDK
jgi:DME family drug/metabolite transporter